MKRIYVQDLPIDSIFRTGNCWYKLRRKGIGSAYVKSLDLVKGRYVTGSMGYGHISPSTEVSEIYYMPK